MVLECLLETGIRPASRVKYPDWKLIAQEFDGIEIAPYQWEIRMDYNFFWYYGWDCASGCLWRPKNLTLELKN